MSIRDRLVQWVGVCLLGGALITGCSGDVVDPSASGAGASGASGGAGGQGGQGGQGGPGGMGGGGAMACTPGESKPCYEGSSTTLNVGLCKSGQRTCNAEGSGFGACVGQVLPESNELCDTLGDDDCDGPANEGCPCMPGSVTDCYSAPPQTLGVGACKGGTWMCNPDGLGFGACQGEVVPAAENCATVADDDCSGAANEGCVYTSCYELLKSNPGATDGTYVIDADGADGPAPQVAVYCDMTNGGYTMVRFDDTATLFGQQEPYEAKCKAYGMEIIVPRSKAHVESIYAYNKNEPANLYNVFPKFEGAAGIKNWKGICNGVECVPWVNAYKDDDTGCAPDPEPNGNNSTSYRLYRWNLNCPVEGGWDDWYNYVQVTGWVICSTNDK
jgi:hypothetical protein